MILRKLRSYLIGKFTCLYFRMNFLKSKRAADKISFEDENQMRFDVETAYNLVNKILNK